MSVPESVPESGSFPESGSVDDMTSDRTSNEMEDRNNMETEAGGDSGAGNDTRGSTGYQSTGGSTGSTGYQSSWQTLSCTQNSDEDSGWPRADEPQQSKQHMTARMLDCCASSAATAAGAPARKSTRVRKKQNHAKLEPDASLQDGVYTLMLRQIPRHYTQLMFLADVSRRGFAGLVDFIYFQFDPRKGKNVGYGFINFTETRHASAFLQMFDSVYLDMEMKMQGRPLRIHPAAVQGYEENFQHFAQTRVGLKSDPHFIPLFMPHGSWTGLPQEIQKELLALQESLGTPPPGRPRAAPAEDPKQVISLSHHMSGAQGWPEQPRQPRALTQDQRDIDLGSGGPGVWGQTSCPEDFTAGGLEEPASTAAAWRGTSQAQPGFAGQVRQPPGLLLPAEWSFTCTMCGACKVGPDRFCSRCNVRALPLEERLPRAAPDDRLLPTEELMGTYQRLEERKLNLLKELAAVHDQQHQTLVSSMQSSLVSSMQSSMERRSPPPLLSAVSRFDQHGLGLQ